MLYTITILRGIITVTPMYWYITTIPKGIITRTPTCENNTAYQELPTKLGITTGTAFVGTHEHFPQMKVHQNFLKWISFYWLQIFPLRSNMPKLVGI